MRALSLAKTRPHAPLPKHRDARQTNVNQTASDYAEALLAQGTPLRQGRTPLYWQSNTLLTPRIAEINSILEKVGHIREF
ncbi:hypothetical protein ACFY2M_33305 [Streptomyces sp. NPDC001276]|uniref:hypothetical protein n=1 Tax=Streptomyces sp. NPDC001276 TaxID=3364555 RepID=UPI0036B06965